MNSEDIKIVQDNLKHIRKVLHISKFKLAEMLGVSRQTIYNYEAGLNKLTGPAYIAIKAIVENYELINANLKQEEYIIAKKLLTTKVTDVDYIKSLTFEEES